MTWMLPEDRLVLRALTVLDERLPADLPLMRIKIVDGHALVEKDVREAGDAATGVDASMPSAAMPKEVEEAITEVGEMLGLRSKWLNNDLPLSGINHVEALELATGPLHFVEPDVGPMRHFQAEVADALSTLRMRLVAVDAQATRFVRHHDPTDFQRPQILGDLALICAHENVDDDGLQAIVDGLAEGGYLVVPEVTLKTARLAVAGRTKAQILEALTTKADEEGGGAEGRDRTGENPYARPAAWLRGNIGPAFKRALNGVSVPLQDRDRVAVLVDGQRLRSTLSALVNPDVQVFRENEWSAVVPGIASVLGTGETFDDAISDLVTAAREYAVDWNAHLRRAANHSGNWAFVQVVMLSTDDELREWLTPPGGDPTRGEAAALRPEVLARETYDLVADIRHEVHGRVPADQESVFDSLVAHAEPDVAITNALNWTLAGTWDVPERLLDKVRRWGENSVRDVYRRAADRALAYADQPGLPARERGADATLGSDQSITTDETIRLAADIVRTAGATVDAKTVSKLEEMIEQAEEDSAIALALYWSVEGRWALPPELPEAVRRWGASRTYGWFRRAAEDALLHADQPGLPE